MLGQASFEFLLLAIATALFALVFFVGTIGQQLPSQNTQTQLTLDSICRDFSDTINNVYYYGRGFSQNFTVLGSVYGTVYNITVYNFTILCNGGNYISFKSVITNNITNGTNYPSFVVPSRQVKIENQGSTLVIS